MSYTAGFYDIMDQTGCIINQPIFFFPLVNLPVMGKQKPRSCVCLPDPWWCMCVFFFLFSPSLFWNKCCDLKVTSRGRGALRAAVIFCLRSSCVLPSKNLWAPSRTAGCIFGCGLGLARLQGEFPLLAWDSALIKHSVPTPAGRARSRGSVHLGDALHAQHIPHSPAGSTRRQQQWQDSSAPASLGWKEQILLAGNTGDSC